MNGSEDVGGVAVVASCDASEVLDAAEHALDGVAVAIEERREAVLPNAVGLWRDVGEGSPVTDLATYGIAVVAFVCMNEPGVGQPVEENLACLAVGDVTARQHEGDGPPQVVGQGVDLGGAAAARAANGLIVLPPLPPAAQRCARTAEESMSICAGGPPALARAWKISLHTPLAAQR